MRHGGRRQCGEDRRLCATDEREAGCGRHQHPQGYIRSIIDSVEVDDRAIRIIGSRDILQAAVAGKQTESGKVRGFVRKWRSLAEGPAASARH